MMNILSFSLPLRSRWFCAPLCLALALAGCGKKAGFDGANAPYGPRTPTTQVHSVLTASPTAATGVPSAGTQIPQVTIVVGQKYINGTNYDRLATARADDPSLGGEYWIKENSNGTLDFAGFQHSSLVGGLIPAASLTLDTPIKVNIEPPINEPQVVTASGALRLTDTSATSSADVTGQYTLVGKDATVATGVGPISGCNHYTGTASSNSDGVPAAFRGQMISAELWYHPSYGVVAFDAPGIGIGTTMTDSSDCGSIDSSDYRTIRKVAVVDSSSSFSLNTYDCDNNLAADKNTHASMLLELRWADEANAMTDTQPTPSVEFGTAIGIFYTGMAESPASIFHPEENGKGFKYWYGYVNQAAKNEPGDNSTAYHITVGGVPGPYAVRVTARIHYKVLPDRVGTPPDAGSPYVPRADGSPPIGSPDGGTTDSRADSGPPTDSPVVGGLPDGGRDGGNDRIPDGSQRDAAVTADARDGSVSDSPADSTGVTTDAGTSCNLIVNGNAEAAIGSSDGTLVSTPGWISAGGATAAQYGVYGWPALTDPGPAARGVNLFSGGPSDATSSLTQTVNVSQFASLIDTTRVTYALSGWLGGWDGQDDSATLTVTFQNTLGAALGTGSIGPVMASDRASASGLLQRSSTGAVPAGTRTVLVVLSMLRASGSANDGYADDLSLVFSGVGTGACNSIASADGGSTTDSRADVGTADAGIAYFTVSTPPVGITAPAGAKISALKTTTSFGLGGLFWKDGRLYSASNSGGPIVSVMPDETGTLWADVPTLAGGSPSWRHGVPLTGGNILLAIDYYGGPTGLHEITPTGSDTPWTLAQGHSGIGDIVALPTGGWVFSDFESYNIFKVSAKNAAETSLIPAGAGTYTPAYLAHDALTDTVYFVNMNNLGGTPWFGGDGAIYKLTSGAPVLVASPTAGAQFNGLAVGLGGPFPAGLYTTDTVTSRVVRVESNGTFTPIITGVPTPSEIRIDPVSTGMALISADQVLFFLP